MENWVDFVDCLTCLDGFGAVKEETVNTWGADLPVVLFSSFGRKIADDFYIFSCADREYIFCLLEKGMVSGDESLKTYVATGILEALDNRCQEDLNLKKDVYSLLGKESKNYLDLWDLWWKTGAVGSNGLG